MVVPRRELGLLAVLLVVLVLGAGPRTRMLGIVMESVGEAIRMLASRDGHHEFLL